MKNILYKNSFFIFIFSFLFLLISNIPQIYEASIINLLPANRTMVWGEHIYPYDYNVYLSKIKQGQEGRWSVVDKYDNNPEQQGVYLQMFYLFTGKFTGWLGISPGLAFHIARIITSFAWILIIIVLAIFFLEKPILYNLGVIFALLSASFPILYFYENQWWVTYFMNWWTEMDILKRISFLPHDTLNYIFISIFSILIYLEEKSKKKLYFPLLCVLIFLSIFVHPAAAMLFFISWHVYYLIKFLLFKKDKKFIFVLIKKSVFLFLATIIPLLYIKFATTSYPWKSLLDFDVNHRLNVDLWDYVLSLGPVFFTGIAGLIIVLIKRQEKLLSLATWVLAAAIALIAFKWFPYQSELRFIQTANHVPLAFLSVYFLWFLYNKLRHKILKALIYVYIILFVLLGLTQVFFSVKSQNDFIEQRVVAEQPLVPYPPQVMYPLTDFYNGLIWLKNNTKTTDVVLTEVTAGNYIPAYSGNYVYLGHTAETPFFDQRWPKVDLFYSGTMTDNEAMEFLIKERIKYVFYGPQEIEKSQKNIKKYSFLTPVFQSAQVTIFRVN